MACFVGGLGWFQQESMVVCVKNSRHSAIVGIVRKVKRKSNKNKRYIHIMLKRINKKL